jgi:hypothetical protein
MQAIFFLCALIGGTIMVCQFFMTVLGLGADADVSDGLDAGDLTSGGDFGGDSHATAGADSAADPGGDMTDAFDNSHHDGNSHHQHGSNWFFVKLTFQTVVAALTFFGLGGMAAQTSGMRTPTTVITAVVAGVAALYIVYWLMELLHKFNSEGNVRIKNAVGHQGTVYVSIPSNNSGAGKILLNLQNRTVELQAKTAEDKTLMPGTNVVVTSILGPGIVEVALVREPATA